jgi:hypothetical protein
MKDDEFMDGNPKPAFARGKSKAVTLKPWQTNVNGEVKATLQRCWDGFLGCEGYKSKAAFRLHPLICDQCAEPMVFRFGISRTDVELLAMVLHMDAGLYRTANYFKANKDKIQAMEAGRDQYIGQFIKQIRTLRNRFEIEAKTKSFRDWWFDSVGVELPKEKARGVKGFVSIDSALPVGDRA